LSQDQALNKNKVIINDSHLNAW